MPRHVDPLESVYYPHVRKYLAERGYITHSFTQAGAELPFIARGYGQMIVDVFGVRGNTDLRTRNIEAVAVEVKRSKTRTSLRHLAQAASYSVLAHRCYLAQPYDYAQKAKSEAARLGVGLLRIRGQKVELIAESRMFEPDRAALASFLNRSLRISQCAVCGCYQFRYSDLSNDDGLGGGHWRRDDLAGGRRKRNKLTFLCTDCEAHWAQSSIVKKLNARVVRLEQRLIRLAASQKKLMTKL